ncbi:MAG: phage tail tape measure protein [Microcystis sp. M38BS1]|uniref:phage tail tape measure protein n=1 Tax=Microcystis sp. M38BS1 TaxID=2771188 RepID=UPI0031FDDD2C|nr:phage tail tape measure protein [Microcystis sp. M38BS1]MCA6582589.1 phage tail tape measure protein [Pseudanabaena sp. M34BS1SP1A06MG]
MAAPSIDTSPSQSAIKDALNKGTLNIGDDIRGTLGNVAELDKSLAKLSGTWASNISQTAKLGASLGALGSIAINATFAVANISSAFNKIQGAKSIVDGAYTSVKNLVGISKSLDFSEAILGTKEFGANIKILEETTDGVFNRISTASQIIFDNSSYQKWSIGAVAAYSKVESAAFRLATITTSSEESALNAVGARIKALRELQRETNFATNSTQTLNAQYDVASAGFASKLAQKSVGSASINLSEVGFADIEGTNQGIVKILSANKNLGDSFRDADKRASQLFATTKVGILTLNQLNSEAAELASTGVGAGVAFEEMATALALVTTQGLSAGEGSTAIRSLVSEIVNNSSKAQEALGILRDEAGKPIQFGFGALKQDGLISIIERLGKATGGSRDALNRIFSSSEAVKAANALLQSGGENRKSFRQTIDEAGSSVGQDKLKQSAKERGETLEGAFRSSFNKSQAAVEDFGSVVGESVKKNLQDTNTLLGVLATKSSSSFGSFAGQLDGIANKFQAVSGFIGSVFSVVAPLAFFSFLFKNLGRLGQTIKQALKLDDGDIKYETLAQKIEAAIVRIAKVVVSKVKGIVQQVNEEISNVGKEVTKGGAKALVDPVIPVSKVAPEPKGFFGGLKEGFDKTTGSIGKLYNATAPIRGVIGGAARELASFAASTALVGGAFTVVATLGQGLITSLNAITNASSIPEVKELAENLKELKAPELDSFVKSLTDSRVQIQGISKDTQQLVEYLDNLKQAYNFVSGASTQNNVTQEKVQLSIQKTTSLISLDQQDIKNKKFIGKTLEEKGVQQKLELGIILNEEDLQTVKDKYQKQRDLIQSRVANIDIAIKSEKDKGQYGSRDVLVGLEAQRESLVAEGKVLDDNTKSQEKRVTLENQLRRLQSFDSKIPLAITTGQAFATSTKAQFNQLKESLNKVFTVDKIDISKIDIRDYEKLLPQLQGALSNITIQASIDPSGAVEALKKITEDADIAKFAAADPTAQKAVDETFKAVAEKAITYNNAVTNSYSKLFSVLSGIGAIGGEAIGQATSRNLEAIRKNIATLKNGLDKPNIDAKDYAETLSKIADLSAEAFNVKNAGQITEELGKRKQLLTFNQSLLEVQKNILSNFAQESKFGSLSVSLAQAKLAAAEKELSVKQESLAISAREEEITKSNILKAAQAEVGNRAQLLQSVLKAGNISEKDAQSEFGVGQKIDLFSKEDVDKRVAEQNKKIAASQKDLDTSKNLRSKNLFAITPEQAAELRSKLVQEELQKISNTPNYGGAFASSSQVNEQANSIVDLKFNSLVKNSNGQNLVNGNVAFSAGSEAGRDLVQASIKQTQEKEKALVESIKKLTESRDSITGSSSQLKERVANIDIESAKKVVQQAEQDLKFTVVANRLKQEIGALAETIARNEAAIDASFAPQQRLVDISKGVGDAFSSLGSTASSLFSASSLGTVFNNIGAKLADKTSQLLLDANKEISKVTARVSTVQAVRDRVASANADATKNGVNNPELKKQQADIERQLKTARAEADRDLQYIRQKTILEGVNASLERFAATAREGSDKLEKVATLANARLDLQGRREASTIQSNQATRGFSSSVLGLFGQNNPAAQALIGRNEILATIEKTQADKNEAGRAGEKELNTLQVQEQQLKTEETMLVNALTQTKLLSVLVSKLDPSSGIQVGDISGVNKFIGDIPKNIADAQKQTLGSLALNRETQSFVKQDTFSKINNIGLNGQSQILDIAQRNPSGGLVSIDLVSKALSTGFATQQPIQNITNRTPFGADFEATQRQLQTIGGSTRDSVQQQAQQLQDQINKETRKITNDFRDASPNKPQTASSVGNTTDLRVVVNNSITIDGVKTTFGGDSLNKVGAAVGKSGDVIEKALTGFGKAFLDLSKTAFGV